ncbi:MAG TPA: DUF72 domain-containing protein [Gaiellaceae bacterium]|nr:DUF72 domain-containing protein [Gaiellaceae bacterium]
MSEVRVGCSGWNYPHWRERVYQKGVPARRWLEHYASLFDTVEVNSTFYRLPRESAVQGWVEQSPTGFLFAAKMSRYLTHIRRLQGLETGIPLFYSRIAPLVASQKLGPVLWQLPPTFKRDDERLAACLAALPAGRHCFEFRHPTWYSDTVYELLRRHRAALVIPDGPKYAFRELELTADWTFIRFHHGRRGRGGNYSETELAEWAERIDGWRTGGIDVFAYFNNDWQAYAVRNGLRLKKMLGV